MDPEGVLNEGCFDYACIGEGEHTKGVAARANQLGCLGSSKGTAAREHYQRLQYAGLAGTVAAVKVIQGGVRLDLNLLQVAKILYLYFAKDQGCAGARCRGERRCSWRCKEGF